MPHERITRTGRWNELVAGGSKAVIQVREKVGPTPELTEIEGVSSGNRPKSPGTPNKWKEIKKHWRYNLAFLSLALIGLSFNVFFGLANDSRADFNQYYAAARLVGSGLLYDWDAIRALELQHNDRVVPFGRLPTFAFAFKPVAAMSYDEAHAVWLGVGLAALAGFAVLWPFASRARAFAAVCWSTPAAICLGCGQDSVLFLFLVTAGLRLLLSGYEFWAGAVLSICASKPHLAVLLPVFLAAKRKWNALLGGLVGGAAIMLVSFVVEGKQWPVHLLSMAGIPEFDPAAARMPNLRGLLQLLGAGLPLEIGLALAIVVVVWFLSRHRSLTFGASLALVGGLLLSHHAYAYDGVLLLPALLLAFEMAQPAWIRLWAMMLFTPLPYFLLTIDSGWAGHILISGYTLAWIAVLARLSTDTDRARVEFPNWRCLVRFRGRVARRGH